MKMNMNIKQAMAQLGSYGGKQTKKKHGKKHFSRIAKLRWKKEKSKLPTEDPLTASVE